MTETTEPVGEAAADEGDYVKIGWLNMEVSFWNPLTIQMVEDYVVCYLMYNGLFTYDENWEGPVGDLALDWEMRPQTNGSMETWVQITDKAYFRNNANLEDTSKKLTAYDVKWTFELIMSYPGYTFDWYLRDIWEIEVLSETELLIKTTYVKATLIDDLSAIPILNRTYWSSLTNPMAKNLAPSQQLGTGPFVYEGMLAGSWYKFKKAPNFFGEAEYGNERTVKVPGILYSVVNDPISLATKLNTGEVDCVNLAGEVTTYLNTLDYTNPNIMRFAVNEPGITDIAINAIPEWWDTAKYYNGNPVLRDPAVREAIMMTLNKSYILNTIMQGLATEATSVVQPGYWQAEIENQLPFDPEEARKVLIAAGYSDDKDGDGYLEATSEALSVKEGWVTEGTELSGIRCEAPDTDQNYYKIATAWVSEAKKAGIELKAAKKSEGVMTSKAWYQSDYDIWVWHWGWGPEPIGAALTCWLTEEIKEGGYNCQGPMGPWWVHGTNDNGDENYTSSPFVNASMIAEFNMEDDDFIGFSAFDQNISFAQRTVDKEERKVITDKLQQWIYDSYAENPPYYDLGLYGVSTARFTGWGNWSAHCGLPVTSDLLWIWFSLEPAANGPPTFTSGLDERYQAIVDQEFSVTIEVKDSEGDPITLNCTWGDGSPQVQAVLEENTDTPTVYTFRHTYTAQDTDLELRITAWDGLPAHTVSTSAMIDVLAEADYGPVFAPGSPRGVPLSPVYIDWEVTWTATVSDAETGGESGDSIKFTWDWGDGTFDVSYQYPATLGAQVTDEQVHSWSDAGTYTVTVYAWDGFREDETNTIHNVSASRTYVVNENTEPYELTVSDIYWTPMSYAPIVGSATDDDPDTLKFTWIWDDGTVNVTTALNTNPGSIVYSKVWHMWDAEGTYDVELWVDDGQGHNVTIPTITATIASDVGPTGLWLTQDPDPGTIEEDILLTAGAYDANGDDLVFTLFFGEGGFAVETSEGGSADEQTVTFTYAYEDEGLYGATLYVDDGTHNSSRSFNVRVTENRPPEISLQSSFVAMYNMTFTVAPTNVYDPDGDDVTVWFDWGDGTAMTMGDPDDFYTATHVYRAVGSMTLTAYADDGMGNNVSATADVSVTEANQKPTLVRIDKVPLLAEYKTGQEIVFAVTVKDTEGDNLTVTISYGDGSEKESVTIEIGKNVEKSVNFTHEFSESGAFEVVATVTDGKDHVNPAPASKSTSVVVAQEKAGTNWILIGGLALLILAAIIIIAMMMRRKKAGGEEAGGMEGMTTGEQPPEPPPS